MTPAGGRGGGGRGAGAVPRCMAGSMRTVKTGKDSPSLTACCPLSSDNESVSLLVHLTSTSCDFPQTPRQQPMPHMRAGSPISGLPS